jgi:hypothetical protein
MAVRLRRGSVVESPVSLDAADATRRALAKELEERRFRMKSRFFGHSLIASFAVLPVVFCLVPGPATAQQAQVSATKAAMSASPTPFSSTSLSPEDAAKAAMPSSATPSPSTPLATDGHPDLTGLWWIYRGANLDVKQVGNTRVNLQPTSRAPESEDPNNNLSVNTRIYDSVAQRRANPDKPTYKPELMAKVERLDRLEAKLDPGTHCKLPGVPRVGPPQQIVQGPGVVVFLYDSSDYSYDVFRVVPTDGHPHRTAEETIGLSPSYLGDSTGRWEGDTLVVDTIDFNGDIWLGIDGWLTTPKLHVIERLRRDGDTLHYQATVEDPDALTKPWVMPARMLHLNRKDSRIEQEEPPCVEMDSSHIVTPEHH